MPDVWLIRHAPAVENLSGTFMGQLDAEADARALTQLAALAGTIAADVVLSSPLLRAARTAAALFPDHAITHDTRLAERHLGDWQGRVKAQVRAERPDAFTERGTLDLCVTPPGGEPWSAFAARVDAIMREIAAWPADRRVALVAHNGVLRTVRVLLGQVDVAMASRMTEPFTRPDVIVIDAAALR
ncbi:MAG: histidine phosphatase family protein [Solirubrobacteraceae bacterium]